MSFFHGVLCNRESPSFGGVILVLLSCLVAPTLSSPDLPNLPRAETRGDLQTYAATFVAWKGVSVHDFARREGPTIERQLMPMVKALPSQDGRFAHAAVFHVLHRILLKRHGWFLKGLEPEGKSWNSTSLAQIVILADLPIELKHVLQEQLHGPGLRVSDVIALAVVTEYLAHQRTLGQLPNIYQAMGFNVSGSTPLSQVTDAVDALFACFIAGFEAATLTKVKLHRLRTRVHTVYPNWPNLRAFIHEILLRRVQSGRVALSDAKLAVQEAAERFGQWQDSECQDMKGALLKLEDHGTGRVRVSDFYAENIYGGKWQFRESIPYLRELGALDESNPNNVRVVIPNYVTGASNCIASSKFSAVCCLNECESIRERIEGTLQSPEAEPEAVAALIAGIPSASIPANRTLSAVMLHRLNGIAMRHGGKVPLYGRLFAQWLHHAYPRECPFPHLSGTIAPKTQRDFVGDNKESLAMMVAHAQRSARTSTRMESQVVASSPLENVAWTYEEELVVSPPIITGTPAGLMEIHLATLAALTVILAFGRLMLRTVRATKQRVSPQCSSAAKAGVASSSMPPV